MIRIDLDAYHDAAFSVDGRIDMLVEVLTDAIVDYVSGEKIGDISVTLQTAEYNLKAMFFRRLVDEVPALKTLSITAR